MNKPGAVECAACDSTCGPAGCSGPGSARCLDCKAGFSMQNGACADTNECEGFPCAEHEKCANTDGGHECECTGMA